MDRVCLSAVEEASTVGGSNAISESLFSRPPRAFSIVDGQRLIDAFQTMINNRTSSTAVMKKIMAEDENARDLVEKYTLSTVHNRIKYEIRNRKKNAWTVLTLNFF